MNLSTKIKSVVGAIVLVCGALYLRSCGKPVASNPLPAPLAPHEQLHMVITPSKIVATTKHETVTQYVPRSSRQIEMRINDGGDVTLDVETYGWSWHPTLGVLYGDRMRVALGAQFAYWNRFGLSAGIAFNHNFMGYGAVHYDLDQIALPNSFLFVGIGKRDLTADLKHLDIVGGIGVRL